MSLGWPNAIEKGYSFLNTVLAQAYASGVVVVTAAGNRTQSNPTGDADDVYPANQAAALTVSAVDRSRTFDDSYSASGASVDLCAPGSYVTVAAPGGGTAVRSGTSFAAPHIAAAAACVLLAQPGLSAARVRQTLYSYADDLGDPGRMTNTATASRCSRSIFTTGCARAARSATCRSRTSGRTPGWITASARG